MLFVLLPFLPQLSLSSLSLCFFVSLFFNFSITSLSFFIHPMVCQGSFFFPWFFFWFFFSPSLFPSVFAFNFLSHHARKVTLGVRPRLQCQQIMWRYHLIADDLPRALCLQLTRSSSWRSINTTWPARGPKRCPSILSALSSTISASRYLKLLPRLRSLLLLFFDRKSTEQILWHFVDFPENMFAQGAAKKLRIHFWRVIWMPGNGLLAWMS